MLSHGVLHQLHCVIQRRIAVVVVGLTRGLLVIDMTTAGLWLTVAPDHVFWRIILNALVIEKHGQNDMVVAWLFKLSILMLDIEMVSVGRQVAEIQTKASVAVEMKTRHQRLFGKPNLYPHV